MRAVAGAGGGLADLLEYVVAIVRTTREHPQIQVGASPRGGLALVQLARGEALLRKRDYVVPDDIKYVAVPALAHRITLRPELWVRQVSSDDVVGPLLATVPTPKTDPAARPGLMPAGPGAGPEAASGRPGPPGPAGLVAVRPRPAADHPRAGRPGHRGHHPAARVRRGGRPGRAAARGQAAGAARRDRRQPRARAGRS